MSTILLRGHAYALESTRASADKENSCCWRISENLDTPSRLNIWLKTWCRLLWKRLFLAEVVVVWEKELLDDLLWRFLLIWNEIIRSSRINVDEIGNFLAFFSPSIYYTYIEAFRFRPNATVVSSNTCFRNALWCN